MKVLILSLLLLSIMGDSFSQTDVRRNKIFNVKKGVALEGYDPVSYFSGKPEKGNERFTYSYKEITYLFSSPENRKKFISNPYRFEPQYGGWCAYAIGESGKKVKIDPLTYKIKDSKLYLFYNFNGYNTLDDWNKKEEALKKSADKNWKLIFK